MYCNGMKSIKHNIFEHCTVEKQETVCSATGHSQKYSKYLGTYINKTLSRKNRRTFVERYSRTFVTLQAMRSEQRKMLYRVAQVSILGQKLFICL